MHERILMTFKKPLFGAPIVALLIACGGGGDDAPTDSLGPPRAITITQPRLSAATPVATVGNLVQFEGGECGGGNGPLLATWYFGDDTPNTHENRHIYSRAGSFLLRVTCTDGSGNPNKFSWTSETISVVP